MFRHGDHKHNLVREARECEQATRDRARKDVIHMGLTTGTGDCAGGVCTSIDNLCSKHQMEYQSMYGRASNE